MDTTDTPKKDSGDTTRTNSVLKNITTAFLVLYAVGWGAALAWQSGWEPSARASYGYQLGWFTCLAAGAVALFVRRAQPAHNIAPGPALAAATGTSTGKEHV